MGYLIDYSEINSFLDSSMGVKNVGTIGIGDGGSLTSWSYSSRQGKFRLSRFFPSEFMEEVSITEMGMLFFLVYNSVPKGMGGHEGYLFDMDMNTIKDGSGKGVSKDTFFSFRNKLLFYKIVYKVNKFKEDDGSIARTKYLFNPRYVDKSLPVVLKGSDKPSHDLMSNYKKTEKPDFGVKN